ncbi:MAG: PIN domain-containing protein [Candidatus Accumulibacter sp.]|nr:PIN domain-containing protein [Accumulibacter sp.]
MKLEDEGTGGEKTARLVLDTNVVMDLLYFRDFRVLRLEASIRKRGAACFTDSACFAELERVAAYSKFGLSGEGRRILLENYRRFVFFWPDDAEGSGRPPCGGGTIPRCRDADDQKFLSLAVRCAAALLVTRDRSLLVLNRRLRGCAILEPEAACVFLENMNAAV